MYFIHKYKEQSKNKKIKCWGLELQTPSFLQKKMKTHKLAPQLERLRYCHSQFLTWIYLMTHIWLTELQGAKVQQKFPSPFIFQKYSRDGNCICPLSLKRRHLSAYYMHFRMTRSW